MRVRCSMVSLMLWESYASCFIKQECYHVVICGQCFKKTGHLTEVLWQGLEVQDYFGNFCKRIPTDVDLPAVCLSLSLMCVCVWLSWYLSDRLIKQTKLTYRILLDLKWWEKGFVGLTCVYVCYPGFLFSNFTPSCAQFPFVIVQIWCSFFFIFSPSRRR